MPYDYLDKYGATDLGVIGGPGADEYEGDSLEEFYDFLMTPRRQKRWSGSGGIKHFGPDRYASISPEDAAMADIIQKQMDAEDEAEFQKGNRASLAARRDAADEMMMPGGKGGGTIQPSMGYTNLAGGSGAPIQVGGGMPKGPPPGPPADPNTGQRMLAGAAGYEEPRSESQTTYTRNPHSSETATLYQRAQAAEAVTVAEAELMQAIAADPELSGLGVDELMKWVRENPNHDSLILLHGPIGKYVGAQEKLAAITPRQPIEEWPATGGGG